MQEELKKLLSTPFPSLPPRIHLCTYTDQGSVLHRATGQAYFGEGLPLL